MKTEDLIRKNKFSDLDLLADCYACLNYYVLGEISPKTLARYSRELMRDIADKYPDLINGGDKNE